MRDKSKRQGKAKSEGAPPKGKEPPKKLPDFSVEIRPGHKSRQKIHHG